MNRMTLESIISRFQPVIDSPEFYFQKGQDVLRKWLNLTVPRELHEKIILLSTNYDQLQGEAERDSNIKTILELLFEIVSYCDVKAKDKIKYNQYEDKRTLAEAAVRMNHWIERLVQFKFSRDQVPKGSILNAFQYLLEPELRTTILSENHRALISKNLLHQDFDSNNFDSQLILYFSKYSIEVANPQNYTYLLSCIIYRIENEWKEEVIGLMAADSTGWQDEYIDKAEDFDFSIIWNTKRPSGTNKTLKFLREIIDDDKTFNLYYCSGGFVNYVATVIDFADSQEQLDKGNWSQRYGSIMNFRGKFEDYKDGNKRATIIFLIQSLEEVTPIPVSDFKFYDKYDAPRQDNLSPIKNAPTGYSIANNTKSLNSMSESNGPKPELNRILYGPPGTGKTFNSINHALSIIENKSVEDLSKEAREELNSRFNSYQKNGRVTFCTFHQSMSYEDFIEGIKPETIEEQVVYEVKDGIFKRICTEASFSIAQDIQNDTKDRALTFSSLYDQFVDSVENTMSTPGSYAEVPTKSGGYIKIEGISAQGNIIVKHPDGTRTYTVSKQRLTELDRNLGDLEKISNVNTAFREVIGGSNSSAYYALLKTIRSLQPGTQQQQRSYSTDDKIGAVKALNSEDYRKSSGVPYVIIIDEINRGNISQIFGELITLIEDDKRLGRSEALEVMLPYSKEKFGVPANVHIIGTMNTADRSVEALDAALRRRFSFIDIPPNPKLITSQDNLNVSLPELLTIINKRIEKLLDKDHLIGHSYFMNLKSLSDLKHAFQNKINPLLQEYFYGDFGKVGLVIGKDFFLEDSVNTTDDLSFFADFEYETSDLLERKTYRLRNVIDMSDSDFLLAINKLLRK